MFPPLAKGDQGGFAVVIVDVEIQPKQALLLQSLLLGEDGLGTIRCFDPERKKQQIWTVQAMLSEVYDWLESLPASLQLQISGEGDMMSKQIECTQTEFTHEGRLITFEGGDGCGKSTQIGLTANWLREQGKDVLLTREPGDTPLGKELRSLLLSGEYTPVPECELLMFLADRAQHVRESLMPALKAGQWVLCDRYSDSTLAYQLAARHLGDAKSLQPLLSFAELGVSPNITIWLDLPVQEALRRIRSRNAMGEASTRLDEEALSFHEQVHAAFKTISDQNPHRITRIDASKTVEQVQDQIQKVLG